MKRFTSLAQFYNSTEWRDFRSYLIAERMNPKDGILYDEHSGEPIVKAYDIIAHHVTPITLANVNDFSVSLNPENIKLVSHRSHNEIHSRFGFGCGKKVYYVYGAPCSGKTSFVLSSKGNSDLIVDADNIWECVTGGERYYKPDALKQVVFRIRNQLLDAVATRSGNWERAYVIEGGARSGERNRRIEALGAEAIFIEVDKQTCLERLASDPLRASVQEVWKEYIEQWFADYQP